MNYIELIALNFTESLWITGALTGLGLLLFRVFARKFFVWWMFLGAWAVTEVLVARLCLSARLPKLDWLRNWLGEINDGWAFAVTLLISTILFFIALLFLSHIVGSLILWWHKR